MSDPTGFHGSLLDAVTQAVVALDRDGIILHWNRQAAALFGMSPQEATGRPFETFIAQTNSSRTMLQRLRRMQSDSGEIVAVRASPPREVPLLVHAAPLRSASGDLVGIVLQAEDITERQRADAEQRLLAEAGAILANSLEGEQILDRLSRLLVPELAHACRFHVVDTDGVGRHIAGAYDGPDVERLFATAGSEPGEGLPAAVSAVIRDGGSTLMQLTDAAQGSGDAGLFSGGITSGIMVELRARGRTAGALELYRKGSERFDQRHLRLAEEIARRAAVHVDNQRLYEAAVLASKSKSDFLAVISHELRTPLTTIMGYIELMVTGVPDPLPARAAGFLERVRTAAWHLLGLIEQILVYARMEAGRENLMPENVIINQLLDDVRALMEPNAQEKGLRFVVEPLEEAFMFTTDLTKARQILLNLASNAIKFTDTGEIHISARTAGADVIITVTDTGIGIPPEFAEQIFDPFWQVDQSATRRVGGAGLGLSVSRRLARLLGGDLTFTSTAGVGTAFEVTLPRGWRPREGDMVV